MAPAAAISSAHALGTGRSRRADGSASSVLMRDAGRRSFLSVLLIGSTAAVPEPQSRKALLDKYLKKSEENKAKHDKERLEDYYKRNYADYFRLIEGDSKATKEGGLSEAEKKILKWLEANK